MPDRRTASEYRLEYGSYYLYEPHMQEPVSMVDQVAFAFDRSSGIFLKHGSPEQIARWWKENRFKAMGLFPDIQMMTFPPRTPVDEINRVLGNSTYLPTLLEKIDAGWLSSMPE